MALTATGKNTALSGIVAVAVKMRLLDGSDNEVVDHDDASQDQSITWGGPDAGVVAASNDPAFEVKAGVTVKSISFRSSNGETEYAREVLAVGDQETSANDGTYTVTSATITISDPA